MANAGLPIARRLPRTGHRLEIHDHVVAEDLALGHDVEVVAVAVLVLAADGGAPLRVAVVGTQVRHHDDYALPGDAAFAAGAAG